MRQFLSTIKRAFWQGDGFQFYYSLDLNPHSVSLSGAAPRGACKYEQKVDYQSYSYRSNLLSQSSVRDGSFDSCTAGIAVYFAQTALQHAQQVSAITKVSQ